MEKIGRAFRKLVDGVIKGIEGLHLDRRNSETHSRTSKDGNTNTTKVIPSLLPDNISDILCRLPIEDIIRYMVVCKEWCTLIKDPHFAGMHLTRALCSPYRFILEPRVSSSVSNLYLIDKEDGKWKGKQIPVENMQANYMRSVSVCHGFLCVVSSNSPLDPLLVYNPITRESLQLPKTDMRVGYNSLSVGFGFDPISKNYKVIQFFELYNSDDSSIPCIEGEIITVGEVLWRKLEVPYTVLRNSDSKPVLLDGELYWVIDGDSHPGSDGILVLDLFSEKFRTIKFPSNLVHSIKFPCEVFLLNIGGTLCLIERGYCERFFICKIVPCDDKSGYSFYLSFYNMMMPYKVFIWSIKMEDVLVDSFLFHVTPANFRGEKKTKEHFALYYPELDKHQIVEASNVPDFFEPNLFIPCLVSPCAAFGGKDLKGNLD